MGILAREGGLRVPGVRDLSIFGPGFLHENRQLLKMLLQSYFPGSQQKSGKAVVDQLQDL